MARDEQKHLHFSEEELGDRRARACAEAAQRGLEGLLLVRQESLYYLTGYDTFGYVFFQCLYLGAGGTMTLLITSHGLFRMIIRRIWTARILFNAK